MRYHTAPVIVALFLPLFLFTSSVSAETGQKLSLEEAIKQALANNLNLKLRQEDVQAAAGTALAAQGKFDLFFEAEALAKSEEQTPLILRGSDQEDTTVWNGAVSKLFDTGTEVSLGYNNSRYDSNLDGLLLNPSYNSGLILELRQPLLKGLGREVQTAALRGSQKQLEAAVYQVDSEAANLAADVKVAYWNFVFAKQNIDVQELSLTLAIRLAEETETKINAGKLAQVEIYQPQSEVARREENLISAERALGTAEDNLKLLLNSQDWLAAYDPVDQPATEPIDLDLPTILDNALQNRPDIKAADLASEAAMIEEQRSKDDIRPDLSLIGGVGLAGTDENYGGAIDNSVNDPDNLWQVGISLSIPLSNATAKGLYQQARANYSRAKTSAELLRQQIRRTVRTTIRDVELAIKALEATRKTSLATLKRLEAEQAKFDSGRATTFDVLAAQEAYAQALSQENLTKITYANILAELDRIQGLVTVSLVQ
jgi:outer membrane protein TolC